MSKKTVNPETVLDLDGGEGYITAEKEVKPSAGVKGVIAKLGKGRLKNITIAGVSVIAALAVFFTAMHFVSAPWRSGDKPMPKFFAQIGMYQGLDFRYFDGISINGVDVGGMTKGQAKKAVNAAQDDNKDDYKITITAGEKSYVLDGKDIVFSVDCTDALAEAKEYCVSVMHGKALKNDKNFEAKVVIDNEKMAGVLTAIQNELHQEPVNATFKGVDATGIQFEKEKVGVNITTENLIADIEGFLAKGNTTGEIIATNNPTNPEITVATLSEKIQLIGTFSTTSTASANSTFNMGKAMGLCDGSVIEPGATWSFNACTGNSNLASAGWKSARVISGGQFVNGYGGGICQASTTIYNAALRANLAIVMRYNHTYPSTYAKVGFDATVDYPSKDLKLQNNSKYPVYLQCIMDGRKLTVNIYGAPDNTFDEITFESSTTNRVAGSHYDVAAYRILWKDGMVVKREQLISSRYSLKDPDASSSSSSEGSSSGDTSSGDTSSGDTSGDTSGSESGTSSDSSSLIPTPSVPPTPSEPEDGNTP